MVFGYEWIKDTWIKHTNTCISPSHTYDFLKFEKEKKKEDKKEIIPEKKPLKFDFDVYCYCFGHFRVSQTQKFFLPPNHVGW